MNTGEFSLLTPLLALGFGLLSFLSPCCLPLLPAYLGMIAGSAGSARQGQGRLPLLGERARVCRRLVAQSRGPGRQPKRFGAIDARTETAAHPTGRSADRAFRFTDARDSAPGVAGAHLSARRSCAIYRARRPRGRV